MTQGLQGLVETMNILTKLTKTQIKAVTHIESPLIILAGPGSGKTRVLAYRMAYLAEKIGVEPENILGLTFTRKAALEMQGRIQHLLGNRNLLPSVHTFHGLCLGILRKYGSYLGLAPDFVINNRREQLRLISHIIKHCRLNPAHFPADALRVQISHLKKKLITPEKLKENAKNDFQRILAHLYTLYQEHLKRNNAVDLDDLIPGVINLFGQEPTVLLHYRKKFQHILVDEYQDTNLAQYQLILLLAKERQNIAIVGDSDQMIFRWRGSFYGLIKRFLRDYPKAKVIHLYQNFRSTQTILKAAQRLRRNRWRKKPLWTKNPKGEDIIFHQAQDLTAEANYIAENIKKLKDQGIPYQDIAILVRTHWQADTIKEVLHNHCIPYQTVKSMNSYLPSNAIALLTLHKAKGIEFSVVFIPGMMEGMLPHFKSLSKKSLIDDEQRLCYVGVSRAKDLLYLTAPKYRIIANRQYPTEISRFVRKILPRGVKGKR